VLLRSTNLNFQLHDLLVTSVYVRIQSVNHRDLVMLLLRALMVHLMLLSHRIQVFALLQLITSLLLQSLNFPHQLLLLFSQFDVLFDHPIKVVFKLRGFLGFWATHDLSLTQHCDLALKLGLNYAHLLLQIIVSRPEVHVLLL
jgi:hypothetical protein